MTTETVIVANARLELLRGLAAYRDFHEQQVRDEGCEPDWLRCVPLDAAESDYQNDYEDIQLAARECAAIGEIELHISDRPDLRMVCPDGVVAITDLGYSRIRAHDAIHETAQEAA